LYFGKNLIFYLLKSSCLLELEEFFDVIYFFIEFVWATECSMRYDIALTLGFFEFGFV